MIYSLQRITKVMGLYDAAARLYLKLLAWKNGTVFLIDSTSGVITLRRGCRVLKASTSHLAYCADLIRFFDYYFGSVEPQSVGREFVADFSAPREHKLMNGLIFRFTSFPEPWDTTKIYIDRAALKPGDIVFDLGAYCGSATQAFSKLVGENGAVFAFEPDPKNFAALIFNMELHKLRNVTPIDKGVWSAETTLDFHAEGNMGSSLHGFLDRPGKMTRVCVTTIPAAAREYQLDRLDFIKMDIEGAEIEALRASEELLKRFKPKLVIEPHRISGRLTTEDVRSLLSNWNYDSEIVTQGELDLPLIYASPKTR